MESAGRDLSNDMVEPGSVFKNNQSTYNPRFRFTPTTGIALPKTSIYFYCGAKVHFRGCTPVILVVYMEVESGEEHQR